MPAPPLPVLLHGFLGFVRIGPVTYFRNVAATLRREGMEVLTPRVPFAGSVAERAQALSAILQRHPSPRFALLGHSMGGLDARYFASHLDADRRVTTVVTVSTPHRGTPVARRLWIGTGILPGLALRLFGPALRDLDPGTRAREPIPDRTDVRYVSYATVRAGDEIQPGLRLFTGMIEGRNDGLVLADSAPWGEFRGSLRADHLEVVGWSLAPKDPTIMRPFDHVGFWREAVRTAVEEGRGGE